MNFLPHTKDWVNGEVLHGKIMLGIGILVLVAFLAILRSQQEFLRGMLIPMVLILITFFGYGGFQFLTRPTHIIKVQKIFQENPQTAQIMEHERATKEHNTYSKMKKAWAIFIILSAIVYFLVSKDYIRGMSVGFIGLFLTILIIDSILDNRILVYLDHLNNQYLGI